MTTLCATGKTVGSFTGKTYDAHSCGHMAATSMRLKSRLLLASVIAK
mgnify:FL=1